jgi:hypothetical protein
MIVGAINMKQRKKSSSRIFGMTYIQVVILTVLGGCAFISILGIVGLALFNGRTQPVTILPTSTRLLPTLTKVPTGTPTKTSIPTKTITPTKKPTSTVAFTPTLTYQGNPIDYIPTENELPNGFILNTNVSGGTDGEQFKSFSKAYTNDYPNKNKTEDPYLLNYLVTIYTSDVYAENEFEYMTEEWLAENWKDWFKIDFNINPIPVQFSNPLNVDRSASYFATFPGLSTGGAMVFTKLQSKNIVITAITVSHFPSGNQDRAVSNAYYYTYLIAQKLK